MGNFMGNLVDTIVTPFESFSEAAGLTTPASRAVFGYIFGYVLQALFKPGISYYTLTIAAKNGNSGSVNKIHKKWAVFENANSVNKERFTWFPWWMWGIVTAMLFGAFV